MAAGIGFIPCNDFSFYDIVLDTAVLLGIVPKRYRELNVSKLDTYFAMARGYQGESGDVKALAMKKWFNTNYHYIVPEIEDDTVISLNCEKLTGEYEDGRHPKSVEFSDRLVDDLCRRDFTINAMAYNDTDGFVDEFKGLDDLDAKIIRCVGEPELRFTEDALRMMRAIRFCAGCRER